VEGGGEEALAGPGLAEDQDRRWPSARRRGAQQACRLLAHGGDRRTLAQELGQHGHGRIVPAKTFRVEAVA
jgi:hypothetical protein